MSDDVEIDLRNVVSVLISKGIWIFGFSIILGLVVFLYFFLQPVKFEANTLISVMEPCSSINLDQASQAITSNPIDNKFAIDLAQSQEVTANLLQYANSSSEVDDFIAKKGNDEKILILTVENESREEAIRLVNFWAEQVVERINSIFNEQNKERIERIEFLENQILTSSSNLMEIQNTISELEGENAKSALEEQYKHLLQLQKEHLYQEQLLKSLEWDAKALLKETENLNETDMLPAEMQIRLLTLQLRQYSDTVHDENQPLSLSGMPPISTEDFHKSIDIWLELLEDKSVENKKLLAQYSEDINTIQIQMKSYNNEMDQLIHDQKDATDAHINLLYHYQELTWRAQECEGKESAKIITQANPISHSSTTKTIAYGVVAFVAGAVLAATFFLFLDWWRSATKSESLCGK